MRRQHIEVEFSRAFQSFYLRLDDSASEDELGWMLRRVATKRVDRFLTHTVMK